MDQPKYIPKIYHQPEKSYHCGACVTATVLDYFGEEPDSIPTLYAHLRSEETIHAPGLYASSLQSYFLRKDWVALVNSSGSPFEKEHDNDKYVKANHTFNHQRIATWRIIHQMLEDGYLCILEYNSAAGTNHFAVVYDAYICRNIYWLKIACSSQGYMEVQVETFLNKTGTTQLFIKPHRNKYR